MHKVSTPASDVNPQLSLQFVPCIPPTRDFRFVRALLNMRPGYDIGDAGYCLDNSAGQKKRKEFTP